MAGRHVIITWHGFHDKQPDQIRGHDGLTWHIEQIIEHRQHPDHQRTRKSPHGEVAEAYLLDVTGPLPGRAGERGRQRVVVWSYGDGSGWWMAPDTGDPC